MYTKHNLQVFNISRPGRIVYTPTEVVEDLFEEEFPEWDEADLVPSSNPPLRTESKDPKWWLVAAGVVAFVVYFIWPMFIWVFIVGTLILVIVKLNQK